MTKSAILLLAAALVVPASAQAACKKADIRGTWAIYATADQNTETGFWTYCTLKLNRTGSLVGSKNHCKTIGFPKSTVSAGKFRVRSNCRVVGSFDVYADTQTISNAWMTGNKQSFTGVGQNSEAGFAFDAVRK